MALGEYGIIFDKEQRRFIETEKIVDVPRYGESTRIPMPRKSQAQELLDIPIPLENRIAHLLPYVEPTAVAYTPSRIASEIGANYQWVLKTAARIGLTASLVDPESGSEAFPAIGLELLREEWRWYSNYSRLDDRVTENNIAEFIGRDDQWVRHMGNELAVFPEPTTMRTGRERLAYPKSLIAQLRHILLVVPPSEGRLTVNDISTVTGRDWEWVKSILDKASFVSEKRRSRRDQRVFNYYPFEALAYVQKKLAERPRPAGDWLTRESMAKQLSKSRDWVASRIEELFGNIGEYRLDDSGKGSMHYPPIVYARLGQETASLNKLPVAGNYLAVVGLARAVRRDKKWVERRLPYVAVSPEKRLNENKQLYDYYPPETVEALLALPDDILRYPVPPNRR